jgi:hypothetical protein
MDHLSSKKAATKKKNQQNNAQIEISERRRHKQKE